MALKLKELGVEQHVFENKGAIRSDECYWSERRAALQMCMQMQPLPKSHLQRTTIPLYQFAFYYLQG